MRHDHPIYYRSYANFLVLESRKHYARTYFNFRFGQYLKPQRMTGRLLKSRETDVGRKLSSKFSIGVLLSCFSIH